MGLLDRLFKLGENQTTVTTELRAGLVTFLTMSYIIFVQPIILSGVGLSWHTVFVATCVAGAVATLLMAFFANYPIALAPAMGHNVLFFTLCREGVINWQTGLGAVFVSGTIFLVMSFWGIREKIVNAVPSALKHAIAVGIGILIAFLGFQWAGVAVDNPATLVQRGDLHLTPVLLALGGLLLTASLIALRVRGAILIGILATAAAGIPLGITSTKQIENEGVFVLPSPAPQPVLAWHVPDVVEAHVPGLRSAFKAGAAEHYDAARVIGREKVDAAAGEAGHALDRKTDEAQVLRLAEQLGAGLVLFPVLDPADGPGEQATLQAVAFRIQEKQGKKTAKVWRAYHAVPTSACPADLERYARDVMLGLPGHNGLFQLDVIGAIEVGILHVVFVFLFLDLFDTIGTLIGVSEQAGLLREGKLPRARGALLSDACGTVIGAGLGTSTVTSYIESSAGVAEGARTGLANIVTALLFLAALFFSPLVRMIGAASEVSTAAGTLHLYPAVAPVLIIIGSIMLRNVVHVQWSEPTEAIPAFIAIMMMPLTFSITDGIAFGFITYAFLKLITGRGREVHWLVYLFAVLFLVRYAYVRF